MSSALCVSKNTTSFSGVSIANLVEDIRVSASHVGDDHISLVDLIEDVVKDSLDEQLLIDTLCIRADISGRPVDAIFIDVRKVSKGINTKTNGLGPVDRKSAMPSTLLRGQGVHLVAPYLSPEPGSLSSGRVPSPPGLPSPALSRSRCRSASLLP